MSKVVDDKFPQFGEPEEYYIMPRVRFHPSIERDDLLDLTKSVMLEKRPDAKLNWKNYSTIIFVEILKSNCYIGFFRDWIKRTKYNWQEHHKRKSKYKVRLFELLFWTQLVSAKINNSVSEIDATEVKGPNLIYTQCDRSEANERVASTADGKISKAE